MTENRIDKAFNRLKEEGKKALITYITCGDGGYDVTEASVLEMEAAGADIIELGVPFSDPVAEGPIIQNASERALERGTTLAGIFEMVRRIRKKTDMPLAFMMYLNTIFRFGTERFFALCEEVGIDAVIVPDMPFEEKNEIQATADAHGVYNISLVTPASEGRIKMIANEAQGFLYCVSTNGVTGIRDSFNTDFNHFFEPIKKYAKVPCAVGFGISSPEAAREMSKYCDGVIVGSAIVKLVGEYGEDAAPVVGKFVRSLKDAISS